MLDYNEVRPGTYIIHDGEPYEVIESHVARTQMRKPQNQTKLRNLISGRVISISFHASDRVEEADIGSRPITFVYENRGQYCFAEKNDPGKRFFLDVALLGTQVKFLKGGTEVTALSFHPSDDEEEQIIGIRLPVKVDLSVTEAPPSIKGDTASGGGKQVVLETGASITAPLFVSEGDIVRVNTETGEYVERVGKK